MTYNARLGTVAWVIAVLAAVGVMFWSLDAVGPDVTGAATAAGPIGYPRATCETGEKVLYVVLQNNGAERIGNVNLTIGSKTVGCGGMEPGAKTTCGFGGFDCSLFKQGDQFNLEMSMLYEKGGDFIGTSGYVRVRVL